jgi:membrane-associated phospholipid phosphatase
MGTIRRSGRPGDDLWCGFHAASQRVAAAPARRSQVLLCGTGELMELTAIITALLVAVCIVVVLTGMALRARVADRPGLHRAITRLADKLTERLEQLTGGYRPPETDGQGPDASTLVLQLVLGLAAVALTAVGVGTLVDNVTDGDGVALVDHPVARFVAAHRTAALTMVMKAVSVVGGPASMTILALSVGVLLAGAWRSWTPLVVLAVTAAGTIGLTVVFKAVLGRARPPLAQAVVAADGFGFPSGHAAAAAAVCGAAAWLCSVRMRSWRRRIAVWAVAAILAALVGISRVYLGVHWTSDVLGGWAFGILWVAVVVSGWTACWHFSWLRRSARGRRRRLRPADSRGSVDRRANSPE